MYQQFGSNSLAKGFVLAVKLTSQFTLLLKAEKRYVIPVYYWEKKIVGMLLLLFAAYFKQGGNKRCPV